MTTVGHVGRIDLAWTADTSVRYSYDGGWESITRTQRVRGRGHFDSSSATATGVVLSMAIQSQSASVGKNRDMFIEVVR